MPGSFITEMEKEDLIGEGKEEKETRGGSDGGVI